MFITTKSLARRHGISLHTAASALDIEKQGKSRGLKPAEWATLHDKARAMPSIFCPECVATIVSTKKCIGCGRWYCNGHIVRRRCQCCHDLHSLNKQR